MNHNGFSIVLPTFHFYFTGIPFQVIVPSLGVMTLAYIIVCLVCSMSKQVKVTLVLTLILGVAMLMIVIGGAVYIAQDMKEGK